MPTLLSINNHYYRRGGAEVVFLEHNRLFSDIGWRVVSFSAKHEERLPSEWEDYFIDFGEPKTLWQMLIRAPQVIYSMEAKRKIGRLLSLVRPDVVHAHNIYHLISPSVFSAVKQHGVPLVMTLHDLKLACPSYTMLAHDGVCERCKSGALRNVIQHRCIKNSLPMSALIFLESKVHRLLDLYGRNVDRFVVPSRFYLNKFEEWGWKRERFTYIPNCVDADVFVPNGRIGKAFLYFGRLSAEKGLVTLIKAAAQAKVEIWFAGKGPAEDRLMKLASDLGGRTRFLGRLDGEKLHTAIRDCRAVILPSEWYENAPLCILESYALGRPVIGARIGGIPELIREKETGVSFESGNVEALAQALVTFAGLPDERLEKMGRAGRQWVELNFTRKHYHDQMLQLYEALGVRSS
jgi:glycosyltransferase involved in cell wall biosynthesis